MGVRIPALVVVPLVATVLTSASAHGRTVVDDPVGDARFGMAHGAGDITRMVVRSPQPGRLMVAVTHAAPTPARSVYLNLRAGSAMYQVRRGTVYRVQTFDLEGGPAQAVGVASARQTGRTVAVSFHLAALGRPRTVGVQAMVLHGLDAADLAPDGAPVRHALSGPAAARRPPPRPTLVAPSVVHPGRAMAIAARGFPPRAALSITLVPTEFRGGNGFGRLVPGRFRSDGQGRATIRPPMPRRYAACAGLRSCTMRPWRSGARVDINLCAQPTGGPLVCARRTARIG